MLVCYFHMKNKIYNLAEGEEYSGDYFFLVTKIGTRGKVALPAITYNFKTP